MTEVHHCLLCDSVYFSIHRGLTHLGFRCLGCKRVTWHHLHPENRLLLGNEQRVGGYAELVLGREKADAMAREVPITAELRRALGYPVDA